MSRAWVFLTLLGLLVGVSAASRLEPEGSTLQNFLMTLKEHDVGRRGGGGGRDETAYLKIKFKVPPSEHDSFIKAWRRLEDDVKKDKDIGVVKFDLEKYITDNIYFTGYSEWESYNDLMTHFQKRYTDDFQKFVADHEISWELLPLKNMSGKNEKGRAYHRNVDRKRRQEELTHVVFTYYVPAMHHDMFLDAWDRKAMDTLEEDGNHIYALRKLATDNEIFYNYGTWESNEDFRRHMTSKHAERFHDCIYKNDIVFYMTPLRKLGYSEM